MSGAFAAMIAILSLWCGTGPALGSEAASGIFSRGAVNVGDRVLGVDQPTTFVSPDKTWRITVGGEDDDPIDITVAGRHGNLKFATMGFVNAELV